MNLLFGKLKEVLGMIKIFLFTTTAVGFTERKRLCVNNMTISQNRNSSEKPHFCNVI